MHLIRASIWRQRRSAWKTLRMSCWRVSCASKCSQSNPPPSKKRLIKIVSILSTSWRSCGIGINLRRIRIIWWIDKISGNNNESKASRPSLSGLRRLEPLGRQACQLPGFKEKWAIKIERWKCKMVVFPAPHRVVQIKMITSALSSLDNAADNSTIKNIHSGVPILRACRRIWAIRAAPMTSKTT